MMGRLTERNGRDRASQENGPRERGPKTSEIALKVEDHAQMALTICSRPERLSGNDHIPTVALARRSICRACRGAA